MKMHVVGIAQDDGTIRYPKIFTNYTWAIKYAKQAGEAARYAEIDLDVWMNGNEMPSVESVKSELP